MASIQNLIDRMAELEAKVRELQKVVPNSKPAQELREPTRRRAAIKLGDSK